MKKITSLFLANCIWIVCLAQAVGIGTNAPHPSAQLDVTSTNKGLLIPRLTLAQRGAIASPVLGLLIYQTDGVPGYYSYNGSFWSITNTQWSSVFPPDIFFGAGNVSIGSTISVANLNVTGDQLIYGSQPVLFFRPQTGATTSQIRFQLTDGSNEFGITHFGNRLTLGRMVGNTIANDLIVASDGNIGIGTTAPNAKLHINTNMMIGPGTPTAGYALSVNGKIISEEVRVEANVWPDYVFENKYPIISLTELENYINKNKHLPNIPSANEVKKEGIALGDMNRRLLEKIEELTLYIIHQDKKINLLEEKMQDLQAIHQ
ncbi:MAG: hypothetical protein ACKVOW_16240 [Chitinophagaceae bacterium]